MLLIADKALIARAAATVGEQTLRLTPEPRPSPPSTDAHPFKSPRPPTAQREAAADQVEMTTPPSPTQCMGPEYRSEKHKPTATVSTQVDFDNVFTLKQTPQLIALLTCVPTPLEA